MNFCRRSQRSQNGIKFGGHILAWDITTVIFLQLFKEIYSKIQDGEILLRVNYYPYV